MTKILSIIKQRIVPPGKAPRKIKAGMFSGLTMELDFTCQTQLYLGLFERELYQWFHKLSFGINTAIDIGAAQGEYALYFLAKTSAKQVLAFEPSLSNIAVLNTNLALNNLQDNPRLKLSDKLVSSSDNETGCTLDSLLSIISPPCLLKMDVDGGEVDILHGASQLLELPQIRWIIETHSPQLEKECIEILHNAGFSTVIIPKAWYRVFIPEQRPSEHNRWLIAVKNETGMKH